MQEVRAHRLTGFAAHATEDGENILIRLTAGESSVVCAMPTHEMMEMIGRLIVAVGKANQARDKARQVLTTVEAESFAVGGSAASGSVALTLKVADGSELHFVLPPALSESLSEALGIAASKVSGAGKLSS